MDEEARESMGIISRQNIAASAENEAPSHEGRVSHGSGLEYRD